MTIDDDPLAEAKAELQDLEEELTRRLEEMDRKDSRPKMDSAVGRLTFMDEMQQYEMAKHGRRNMEARLNEVRAAQARVENGTFGICLRCGEKIVPERLEFKPEAAHCVRCQDQA